MEMVRNGKFKLSKTQKVCKKQSLIFSSQHSPSGEVSNRSKKQSHIINKLLTSHARDCTGGYWPSVVFIRTECCHVPRDELLSRANIPHCGLRAQLVRGKYFSIFPVFILIVPHYINTQILFHTARNIRI